MAEHTLVAVARPDGRFDCHLVHWGDDSAAADRWRLVDRGVNPDEVLALVDGTLERLVVHRAADTVTCCVCWLDPALRDVADVALAEPRDSPEALRDWWTEAKSDACTAVANGVDPETARAGLLTALRDRAAAVHVDDAPFLHRGR